MRAVRDRISPVLAALLLWLVPLALVPVFAFTASRTDPTSVNENEQRWVAVGSRQDDSVRAVQVAVARGDTTMLMSSVSGVLTSATRTRERHSGDVLAEVDGRPVYVYTGATPMFRPLRLGASGRDVVTLNRFLIAVGTLVHDPGGSFTRETDKALRAFQRLTGVTATGVAGPDLAVFAPRLPAVVRIVPQLGQSVGAGQPLAELGGVVSNVLITAEDGSTSSLPPVDADVSLQIGARTVSLPSWKVPPRLFAQVAAAAGGAAFASAQPVSGRLVVTRPETYGAVPASSVRSDASGRVCVLVRRGSDESVVEVPAAVPDSGEVGTALVPADLIGSRVSLNWPLSTYRWRGSCAS